MAEDQSDLKVDIVFSNPAEINQLSYLHQPVMKREELEAEPK
jgi:hypothetical protein